MTNAKEQGRWDDDESDAYKEAPDDIDPIFGTEDSTISIAGPPAGTQPPANMFDDEEDEAPVGEGIPYSALEDEM